MIDSSLNFEKLNRDYYCDSCRGCIPAHSIVLVWRFTGGKIIPCGPQCWSDEFRLIVEIRTDTKAESHG